MGILEFMQKNKEMTFVFLFYDAFPEGDAIRVKPDVDNSRCFGGYNAFLTFMADGGLLYRHVYKPLLKAEIDNRNTPYYLDDSSVLFALARYDNEKYWVEKSYLEKERAWTEHLIEIVQGCTDVTEKVG